MLDPFARQEETFEIQPAQKIGGAIAGLYKAVGRDFVTSAVDELPLVFEGIPGDVHAGHTRKSGAREPWYPRGTEMRNERQLSILSVEEMRLVARRLIFPSSSRSGSAAICCLMASKRSACCHRVRSCFSRAG